MALHYLSGDSIGATKKKAAKKAAKAVKKAAKKETKAAKKEEKKGKPKKVAVISLVAVRTAALTVINLNLLKTATKLARVWVKPGGKDDINRAWVKLGGDVNAIKKAIAKGSKQTISGDDMGVAVETAIAAATPALIILAAIIKKYGAGGDSAEASEFDEGIQLGKETLDGDLDIKKGNVIIPGGGDVGLVPGGGDEPVAGSLGLNPATISCVLPLMISQTISGWEITYPVLYFIGTFINLYCVIGLLFAPFAVGMFGDRLKAIALPYFSVPAEWVFYKPINFINGKVKKFALSRW